MADLGRLLFVAVGGYLLGSVPVAVLALRRYGIDPREVGDRNPGFWNAKDRLGVRAAAPVLAGDTAKGAAAGLLGLLAGGHGVTGAYLAVAAAMIGHAWPVFAGFAGGRCVLTFVGGFLVIAPAAALAAIGLTAAAGLGTRSLAIGARVGVFSAPVLQLAVAGPARVAATGALMSIIGLRFALAARRPGRADPR